MAMMGCVIGLNETYNQYEKEIQKSNETSIDQEIEKFLGGNKRLFINSAPQITNMKQFIL